MTIESINPVNDQKIKSYTTMEGKEVDNIIDKVHSDFLIWNIQSFKLRAACLLKMATDLLENKLKYGRLMAEEMGKPITQGCAEIEKCVWVCRYYAEQGELFLKDEIIKTEVQKAFITYQPLGIILGIMPWNFPFWQVFRAAVPTMMAGNGFLLKHSSNVIGCALAIESIFKKAGFPENLFRALIIENSSVKRIIENKYIQGITLTGSSKAGATVAAQAGAVIKKTVLELGGSDPYIVLANADIESAVKKCVTSRMLNAGQSCIAAKRFIVEKSISKEFQELFVEEMKTYIMGNPIEESCNLGPMARKDLRDSLHIQVEQSIKAGAKVILGGKLPASPGAYYPPTVLINLAKGMPAYDEEMFGPVASIIVAKDEAEAIDIANDTSFGLGAAVFTKDIEKGQDIARNKLQAGSCFVNDFVKSDPRLPFGGIKESGYGRELGLFGIHEFVNIKTVSVF